MRPPPPSWMCAHDPLRSAPDRTQDLFVAPGVRLALSGDGSFARQISAVRPNHFDGNARAARPHDTQRSSRSALSGQYTVDIDRDLDLQPDKRKHKLSHRDRSLVATKPNHLLMPMTIIAGRNLPHSGDRLAAFGETHVRRLVLRADSSRGLRVRAVTSSRSFC